VKKTVKLTKWDRNKAEKFADLRCGEDQTLYKKRGNFKRLDIVTGALAELAAYKLLREIGLKVTAPDFEIHAKGKKSFAADLTDYDRYFHVKGQTIDSTIKYGGSWIMQKSDPIINFPKKKHYVIPCTVDIDNNEVDVHGLLPIISLIDNACFDELKVDWLRYNKIALYLDYIESTMSRKARWGLIARVKEGR
jgi:hypothetical protein